MIQSARMISCATGGVAVDSWTVVWRISILGYYDVAVGREQIRLMRKSAGRKGTKGDLRH